MQQSSFPRVAKLVASAGRIAVGCSLVSSIVRMVRKIRGHGLYGAGKHGAAVAASYIKTIRGRMRPSLFYVCKSAARRSQLCSLLRHTAAIVTAYGQCGKDAQRDKNCRMPALEIAKRGAGRSFC